MSGDGYEYGLTIEFDDKGLNVLSQAHQVVTIVKSVSVGLPVAWVSFDPMQNNTVEWNVGYSVYASTTAITEGAHLFTRSSRSADGGTTYTLASGHFDDGTSNLAPSTYGVLNNDPAFKIDNIEMVTSGLYQGAAVNGSTTASPLNAVALPLGETAEFIPVEKIQIFASDYQDNGMVISTVASKALLVNLTGETKQSVHYNSASNQFSLGPLPAHRTVQSTPPRW